MGFRDFKTTKLGELGESIVDEYLTDPWNGTMFYADQIFKPIDENSPHLIDRTMYLSGSLIGYDVKTKASMDVYPATGIDYKDYKKYKEMAINQKVMLFFVDTKLKKIYGGFLGDIDKKCVVNGRSYPWFGKTRFGCEMIYLPLENMIEFWELTDEQIEVLRGLSSNG